MPPPPTPLMKGACACLSTTWTSPTRPTTTIFCYCTTCQQTSGSPFTPWLSLLSSTTVITGPNILTIQLSDIATRSFCGSCGSTIAMRYLCYPSRVYLAAGTVAEGKGLVGDVGCHMFVAERPEWYGIPEDGVPRWKGFDEEFEGVVGRWREEREREKADQ